MTSPSAPPGASARPPRQPRRPGLVTRVAADARVAWAVAMVLAAALGAVSLFLAPLAITERDREQVREVAGAMAARVATFSSDDLDAWADDLKGLATAEYAEEVDRLVGDAAGGDLAQAAVVSRGQVADLYVQSLDGPSAEVFAVVRQTTGADQEGEPASSLVRLTIALRRTGGQWRVSGVSVLPDAGAVVPGSR